MGSFPKLKVFIGFYRVSFLQGLYGGFPQIRGFMRLCRLV